MPIQILQAAERCLFTWDNDVHIAYRRVPWTVQHGFQKRHTSPTGVVDWTAVTEDKLRWATDYDGGRMWTGVIDAQGHPIPWSFEAFLQLPPEVLSAFATQLDRASGLDGAVLGNSRAGANASTP
jgi:hypothetical protein